MMSQPDIQPDFQLARDGFGRLHLTLADGETHTDVIPVRAFPISAREHGLSLMNRDGHELVWIANAEALSGQARTLITEALAQREFMPEIHRLLGVSTFATPSIWTVETDRGTTSFILKGEEDIRRAGEVLLVADSHGIQFLIRDPQALDRHSRRLLDRFL